MFPLPPSGPGLTSRSSTDTSSFSTASMAAAPAILTPRSLLCHRLHGPLVGPEGRFRRPAEASPFPTQSQSLHVADAEPAPPPGDAPPLPSGALGARVGALMRKLRPTPFPLHLWTAHAATPSPPFVLPSSLYVPSFTEAALIKFGTVSSSWPLGSETAERRSWRTRLDLNLPPLRPHPLWA